MKLLLRWLLWVVVLVFCLAPIAWQIVTSFSPAAELTVIPPWLPTSWTVAHYQSVLRDADIGTFFWNSAIVAGASTLLAVFVGALAAFALSKLRVRARTAVLVIILAASMFPPVATVSPLFLLINAAGLRDTLAALIIVYTGFTLPMAIWLMTHFFDSIPEEIHAASVMDGCTPWQSFRSVMLPLTFPGLFATALIVFIFAWNEFLFALTFTSTEASRTLPVAIALFPGLHETPWGEIAAASMVATAPLLVLAFIFQRRIVEGVTSGAVKG